MKRLAFAATLALSSCFPAPVAAGEPEMWLAFPLASYHGNRTSSGGHPYNERNFGFGLHAQFSPEWAAAAGFYRNSFYRESEYVGAAWTPLAVGPVRLGALAGIVTGYEKHRWAHPYLLPVASVEGRRFALDFGMLPPYQDFKGLVALQVRVRVP